ncbi:MAG: glycosyltransferase family 39 protein [Phycisphaerae bacterium]|nr:glycosyltransferase family 39 protein [Phycisphaerae bacterium]
MIRQAADLRPLHCRIILIAIALLLFAMRLEYLLVHCPIDLAGDEAQYWDWSRRLGLCYYSKGPAIAYIIRASCAIFGDVMWAVRLPALLFGAGTMIVTYDCTRRLFASERLALGAALLLQLVPIVIAGGYLITIDSPLFFCWAIATDLLAVALFQRKSWAWPVLGAVIGIGSLAKYAMLLYLPIMAGVLLAEDAKVLKTTGPWITALIGLLCMTPALVWNYEHRWVSLRHVAHQTGAAGGALSHGNTLETIGGQIGAAGPTVAVLITAGVIHAYRSRDRRAMFLCNIGISFLAFNLLASFVAKVQQNWPAPAYFSLVIVAAWFLATRITTGWRRWRGWLYASIIIGVGTIIISRDPTVLFPLARPFTKHDLKSIDLLSRLRGWQECGNQISADLQSMPSGSFVLADDYQQTAEMAFYVRGQPITYCAGPYIGARLSQYDMWPDHRLDSSSPKIGLDAIYLGKGGDMPSEVPAAFDSIERLPDVVIIVRGVEVKRFRTWKCRNFKGFHAIGIDSGESY